MSRNFFLLSLCVCSCEISINFRAIRAARLICSVHGFRHEDYSLLLSYSSGMEIKFGETADLWDDESSFGQLLHHRVEFVRRSAQQRIGSLTKHVKSLSDLIETAQHLSLD